MLPRLLLVVLVVLVVAEMARGRGLSEACRGRRRLSQGCGGPAQPCCCQAQVA